MGRFFERKSVLTEGQGSDALRRHRFTTQSRPNRRSPSTRHARAFSTLAPKLEVTEMAGVIAVDVVRTQTRHWAARPLPEPPRSHRMSKSAPPQHDRIGMLL